MLALLLIWEGACYALKIPAYLLPAPSLIIITLYNDVWLFIKALGVTSLSLILSLLITCFVASSFAVAFHFQKRLERVFMPIIVVLQVTPLVAVIPLLLIWFESGVAVIVSAVLIAFIPLFMSIKAGFDEKNTDISALFTLYNATEWQKFRYLSLHQGLTRFRETLPLTGSLALVGTIVGEFIAGTTGGLASLLIESQYRLNTPRLFACLAVIALLGLSLNAVLNKLKTV
jgi:NitT/TauT family transport system permease protein